MGSCSWVVTQAGAKLGVRDDGSQASHGAALESAAADGVAVRLSLLLLTSLWCGAEVSRKTLLRYGQ